MKQKGGIRVNITKEQYDQIMKTFSRASISRLPIPSQTQTICAIDSFQSTLWYTDGIRDTLWNHIKKYEGNINIPCNDFNTMTLDEILNCWLLTAGVRIAGILLGSSIQSLRRRSPSMTRAELSTMLQAREFGKTDEQCSLGDEAGIILHAFVNKLAGRQIDVDKTSFELPTFWNGAILSTLWRILDLSPNYSWLYDNKVPKGAELVAKIINCKYIDEPNRPSAHAVAFSKIGGNWHYLDNEVGITIPINSDYNNDSIIGNSVLGFRTTKRQGQVIRTTQVIKWDGNTITPISHEYELKQRQNQQRADKDKVYNWKQIGYILIVRKSTVPVPITPHLVKINPSLLTTMVPVAVIPRGNGIFDVTEEGTPTQRVQIGPGSSNTHLKIDNEQFPVEKITPTPTSTSSVTVPQPSAPASKPILTPKERQRIETNVQSQVSTLLRPRFNPETEEVERQLPRSLKVIAPTRSQLRLTEIQRLLAKQRRRETQRRQIEERRFQGEGGRRRKTYRKRKINVTDKKT